MSIFSSLQRAFGYSEDPDETDEEATSPVSTTGHAPATPSEAADSNDADHIDRLTADIFAETVSLFDNWMPDFVAQCVSTEQQRAYLLRSLSEGLQQRLAEAVEEGRRNGTAQLEADYRRMTSEMAAVKERNRQLDQRSREIKDSQLSAERQKRALTERVGVLEQKMVEMEAEKEQLSLENRSMLNRLRAAGVHAEGLATPDIDALEQNVAQLTQQLNESASQLADTKALLEQRDTAIAELQSQLQSLRESLDNAAATPQVVIESRDEYENATPHGEGRAHRQNRSKKRNRKNGPAVSAIDTFIDTTDWLVPPEPQPIPRQDDGDFGYKEPQRREIPDNDAQMSLW